MPSCSARATIARAPRIARCRRRSSPARRIRLGSLTAVVEELLGHPRLIAMRFENPAADVWAGLARHGRPIQYAHMPQALQLWDVWTPIAAQPVAYEPPSAGSRSIGSCSRRSQRRASCSRRSRTRREFRRRAMPQLDRLLPFDEPYRIPAATEQALRRACREDRRVVAIGTTVVRALEHSAARFGAVRRGRRRRGPAHRRADAVARRRCDSVRHARAGHQPLRPAARVRRRAGSAPRRSRARARTASARTNSAIPF